MKTVSARALALLTLAFFVGCVPDRALRAPAGLERVEHVVVIYAENRSFDHLYGLFPGAEGIASATPEQKTQLDRDGRPLPHLPATYDPAAGGKPRPDLPTEGLPNGPFRIDAPPINRRWDEILPNPVHAYWQNREQIDGGRNDRFVAATNVGAWTMGYFDGSQMKLWRWASEYTLADHFFMGAFGGSYLNHLWLVCACTLRDPGAPERPQLDGERLKTRPASPASVLQGPAQFFDGRVTPDGYTVNTSQPPFQPSGIPPAAGGSLDLADPAKHPVPPAPEKTIGDTLSAKGVSWAWYAGGWNAASADGRRDPKEKRTVIYAHGRNDLAFQPHHQPFNYFERYAPGTAERAAHLKDYEDLVADIDRGALPQVAFYKPVGRFNQHPNYADLAQGDEHIDALLVRLRSSPQWGKMLVIVTYDENGGFWDHVPPPAGDRWGPGTRIPAIIVSPFARRGYVDKTSYDTTSILKFITLRFGLEPLPGVRAQAGDLSNALDPAGR